MKTIDELLAVVADQYIQQATRATKLYGVLQTVDGYDMGGGCSLLVREGEVSVLSSASRYPIIVARVYWKNQSNNAETGCCKMGIDPVPPVPSTALQAAFDDIKLRVELFKLTTVQVGKETISINGLVTSYFESQSFARDDLDTAVEYLFAYLAAVKQRIRDR